ncbi:hypothetical protein DH2020_015759 [Rehmannia glutinosa]|uniref:Uncharacterized protein n=1 Tax=Rehmannia glutinosa TaxID=99300 RepID=A0ABR0WTK1_REHGL
MQTINVSDLERIVRRWRPDYDLKNESYHEFNIPTWAKLNLVIEVWIQWFGPHNLKIFATEELGELFNVPKRQQISDEDDTLQKNELVAAFISFLVQILHYKTDMIVSFGDRVDCLQKELRFVLTVLGDTSVQDAELEAVDNLMSEFEAVANETGNLVCLLFFTTEHRRIEKDLVVLFSHFDLLRAHIIEFPYWVSFICKANITPKVVAVDSLFTVDSLVFYLKDLLDRDDSLIPNMKDQIKILHQDLMYSLSFLKDMKVDQRSEIKELKEPVVRIIDVAYEAEYLIHSFLVGDAPLSYFSLRLPHVIHKIKLIGNGLQEIKRNNYDYGALKFAHNFGAQLSLQAKRNSEVADITVGLEDEATYILDQLVGGTQHLQSISIFGMPGLGKTTFAKKLYNHPCVNYRFDRRSWCVVSQMYQRKRLLIDILISSGCEDDKDRISKMEEENLVERIYKSLKGRRYLIVMDDIWDSNVWDDLRRCFPDDGNGSRILFTTRNKDVAPPNSIIHALPSLSNEQCWELLEKKVFHNDPCPPQLVGIGKEIATNCCGLPLAVVVIAGILLTGAKEESTWKNVEGRLASLIFYGRNNSMMQILEQSYKYLPKHLKPCFLYFGALPEYTEIPVRKLKWLWIAEGFIHEEDKKSAESVAEIYLMELIDKSLVMVAKRRSDGGVKACVIHDLLRDLCLKIAEEENFLKWVDKYPDLRFLTQFESLHISASHEREMPTEINFPSNIKKLTMKSLRLPWEKINSTIGILPNLEVLKLGYDAFVGGKWETRDGEFQQLRFLKLQQLGLNQWNVSSSEHFPRLRRLVLRHCYNLREIPCEIGEIATMQLIEVDRCRKEVRECVIQIEQEQRDMGNEDIRVVIR